MISDEHQQYLHAMGVRLWQSRDHIDEVQSVEMPGLDNQKDWQVLESAVNQCMLCDLHRSRQNVVFGVGTHQADVLFVGEAPGANEDKQGEPFVGRAGMLLTAMLQSIGLTRKQVYIANILKCRPPNNRDPLPSEVACCTHYLQKQIQLLNPKVIVAVGRIAAHFLLETSESLGRLRGNLHQYIPTKTPLLVTYHPAYLLRSPKEKIKAYVDLQKIQQLLDV